MQLLFFSLYPSSSTSSSFPCSYSLFLYFCVLHFHFLRALSKIRAPIGCCKCIRINHDFSILQEIRREISIHKIYFIFAKQKSGQVKFTSVSDFYYYCFIKWFFFWYFEPIFIWKGFLIKGEPIYQNRGGNKCSVFITCNWLWSNISKLPPTSKMMLTTRFPAT